MKKTLVTALTLAGAVGAYAQGTVNWNDHTVGTEEIAIYGPQAGNPGVSQTGNSSIDSNPGTTQYTGPLIGGNATDSGPTGYGNGNNFTAQLFAAPGTAATSFGQLTAVGQYSTTFYTAPAGAGFFKPYTSSSDPGVPGAAGGTSATLAVGVWFNGGGTYSTLAAAQSAGAPTGESPLWTQTLGTAPAAPPFLTGLQSFSLTTSVPEPSTIALGIMGASAFLMRRRMSK